MSNELFIAISAVLLSCLMSVLGFLIRSLLNNIQKDISNLAGSYEPLRKDLKENTEELVKLRTEIKAVWRYIDAQPRQTDRRA